MIRSLSPLKVPKDFKPGKHLAGLNFYAKSIPHRHHNINLLFFQGLNKRSRIFPWKIITVRSLPASDNHHRTKTLHAGTGEKGCDAEEYCPAQ